MRGCTESSPTTNYRHCPRRCAPTAAPTPTWRATCAFTVTGDQRSGDQREAAAAHHQQRRQRQRQRPGRLRAPRTAGPRPDHLEQPPGSHHRRRLRTRARIAANTWVEYNVTGAGITGNGTYAFVRRHAAPADGTDLYSREADLVPSRELIVTTGGGHGDTTPPDTTITAGPVRDRDQHQRHVRVHLHRVRVHLRVQPRRRRIPVLHLPEELQRARARRPTRSQCARPTRRATPIPRPRRATWTVSPPARHDADVLAGGRCARGWRPAPPPTTALSTTLRADGGADPDVESYLRFVVTGPAGPADQREAAGCTPPAAPTAQAATARLVYGTGTGLDRDRPHLEQPPAARPQRSRTRAPSRPTPGSEYNVTGA